MMKKLLTIDLGNTHITLGLWEGEELRRIWRVATDAHRTADEYAAILTALFIGWINTKDEITAAGCSVVPPLEATIAAAIKNSVGADLHWLTTTDFGIPVVYDPPSAVGLDRLANVLAAREGWGAPVIVIDFGTATTVDALNSAGDYVGGAILAGVELSATALWQKAARLLPVDLDVPVEHALGQSTADSIRAGLVLGSALAADGLVERIWAELGTQTPVIVTGGVAPLLADRLHNVTKVVPELTLQGIKLAAAR
jgi:type III pantothenate kinase